MTSDPKTRLFLSLRYRDAPAALRFLPGGLGFSPASSHPAPDDPQRIQHAQLDWPGGGGIMFGTAADDTEVGVAKAYLVVDSDADVDRLHRQALEHGFTTEREPADTPYGGRGSTVRDPEGNSWSLGSYPGE